MGLNRTQRLMIEVGVRNLREFGYPDVSADNILTDRIYSAFFRSMLVDNLGQGANEHINALIKKIDDATGSES